MSGRVLFTREEYDVIMPFLVEYFMFFYGFYGVSFQDWEKIERGAYRYLEANTIGKATCPYCDRLCVATTEDGLGWCVKCY